MGGHDVLDWLLERPGLYWGMGNGPESGTFVGRVEVESVLSQQAVSLSYEAWSEEEGFQHAERALLGRDPDGVLELTTVISERLGTLRFREGGTGVFTLDGPMAMRIVLRTLDDDVLTYAWWWAKPGDETIEQSKAVLHRVSP